MLYESHGRGQQSGHVLYDRQVRLFRGSDWRARQMAEIPGRHGPSVPANERLALTTMIMCSWQTSSKTASIFSSGMTGKKYTEFRLCYLRNWSLRLQFTSADITSTSRTGMRTMKSGKLAKSLFKALRSF